VATTMSVGTMLSARYTSTLALNLLTCGIVILIYYSSRQYLESREREQREAALRSELAQAQLEALRRQLHPHFLFNTLHTVSALMAENVDGARRVLARLADLLRMSLDRAETDEVPLRDEMTFLQSYLDIQRVRFHDRLAVRLDIDPVLEDALVPS